MFLENKNVFKKENWPLDFHSNVLFLFFSATFYHDE